MAKTRAKYWYQSKTIWLAILEGVGGIVTILTTELPEVGGLLILKALIEIGLRFVTKLPVEV